MTDVGIKARHHSNISRRTVLKAGAAGATLLAAPYGFTKARAASDPKRLILYNFDGNLGEFYTKHWIGPFVEKHDVKVDIVRLQGSRAPMDKVQAKIEAGEAETDFLPMHRDQYIYAVRNNLLEETPSGALPEVDNFYPEFVTPHGPSLVLWCYGLAYNTEEVSPAPTSWKALWDPQYAGRIAINEALKDQSLEMVNLAFKGQPYPVDEETFQHLTELRPNLVSLWENGAQAEQLFRTGEIVMSPFWNGRVTKLRGEGLPLEFAVPDEGFFVRSSVYGIPKNARNPDLAREWLNFVCAPEQQKALVSIFGYGTANKLVKHTEEEKNTVIVADPEVVKKAVQEDFEIILDKQGEWTDMWNAWKAS